MRVPFVKMDAAGNDYVYFVGIHQSLPDLDWSRLSRWLANRHTGIGSDGIILAERSEHGDATMRIFNADGSEGDMCGNGIRCLGAYLWTQGLVPQPDMNLHTRSGMVAVRVDGSSHPLRVRAQMPPPRFERQDIPFTGTDRQSPQAAYLPIGRFRFPVFALAVGNPNCVLFVRDVDGLDLDTIGPIFEHHPWFPQRTNVLFAQRVDSQGLRVGVWERGSGPTLACGTGASAAAVAAVSKGHCVSPVRVQMPGGTLEIEWDQGENLYLSGPVHERFRGSVEIPMEFCRSQ